MTSHHPIFSKFKPWSGIIDSKYMVNFLGVFTNKSFLCSVDLQGNFKDLSTGDRSEKITASTEYPKMEEGYFEMINVLETAVNAKNTYTLVELGAGFGPHLVNGAAALRAYHGSNIPYKLIGVEGEPTSFKWMNEHMKSNGINPDDQLLFQGAVSDKDGYVLFEVGCPGGYGCTVVPPLKHMLTPLRSSFRLLKRTLKRLAGKPILPSDYWTGKKGLDISTQKVKAVALSTLLEKADLIDLMHVDIQGAEYTVLSSSTDLLNKKIKRVHIGTHSEKLEENLRAMFKEMGWVCKFDFPGRRENSTEYGTIKFADGVQTWINPGLAK